MNYKTTSLIFLFIVAFIVYSNSLYNNFIDLDDMQGIVKNPYISDLSWKGIKRLVVPNRENIWGYYPTTNLSNMACFAISGKFDPFLFRLVSVLIHCFSVLACYFVVSILCSKERIGFWAAFIFALHPSHTEAVNWITANNHLYAALFGMLSIYFYVMKIKNRKTSIYALSIVMFILANMSKESVIMLPFLLLLYECWIAKEKISVKNLSINNPLYSILPFFFISAMFAAMHLYIFPHITSYLFVLWVFKWGIVYKFPALFMQYLGNALLPINNDLAGVSYLPSYFDSFYFSMLILFVVFLLICYYFKITNQKLALFGIIAFVFLLLPGTIKIEVPTPLSLRLLYFPSFGVYMTICIITEKVWKTILKKSFFSKFFAIVLCLLIFTGLGTITLNKNKNWYSSRVIWSSLLKSYPERMLGLWRLYMQESDYKKAVALLEEINQISESSAYGYPFFYQRSKFLSYYGLSDSYIAMNVDEEKIKGIFYDWYNFEPQNAFPLWRLGSWYEEKGLLKQAQLEYEKAVKVYTESYDFWVSLARICEKQGFTDKAKLVYKQIYRRWPDKNINKQTN